MSAALKRLDLAAFRLPPGRVQVGFSGGRTSAFMLDALLAANDPWPADRVAVIFTNTGLEAPQTLDFIAEFSRRRGVPVTWLEYRPEAPLFEEVGHNSASRDGAPFEALIRRRKYLPNQNARFCTAELKIRTAKRYLVAQGWARWTACIGIRADEARRIPADPPRERWSLWHPLAAAGVSKRDVAEHWAAQDFDLQLANVNGKTPEGNCRLCFLKSEKILAGIIREDRAAADWWLRMEAVAGELSGNPAGAKFSKRFSYAELRRMVELQGDWIFDAEGALCQADDGECF